ncbi:MAG TPA: hypothetical protein PKE21_05285 [Flavobacteriales bacterium]|nr:hypothetical protein [Flavobacteriales bacterium]HMR26873.1 hypothetical protein [Flavobacteriales bacterium]
MNATEPRLRVGLLCDGAVLQRWQAECLRQVLAVEGVGLVLVVRPEPSAAAERSTWQRLRRHPWRITLYLRYRRRHFKPAAMEPVDLTELLQGVPAITCAVEKRGHGQYFRAQDLDRIRAHRPDVLLRFGFNILRGEVLEVATHGVWSFHHGDEEHYRGGPPGFWELLRGEPVMGAVLQRLTDKLDGGRILHKGWFGVVDHSLRETVDTVLRHSAAWPALVMRRVLGGDADAALGRQSPTSAPILRYPANLTFLRFLFVQLRNKLRFHKASLARHEEWNIGVLNQPIHRLLEEKPSLNVRWLPAPAERSFRADPFGFTDAEGQLHVLYEKYDHARAKGEIARLRPKRDNVLKRSRTLLDLPEHLSYPFVLTHEGRTCVIPEQAARGRVQLYVIDDALSRMEPVATLLEEPLYDPTPVHWNGRWWLFGTKAPLTNTELFLYHAADLHGPYTPHPLNPVKTDVRSARPAGTPFVHQGALYRPGQDSSLTYGGRVVMHRVLELSPTAFSEEAVRTVGPITNSAYSKGLHTVSAVGDVTLVDGKRFVRVKDKAARERTRKWNALLERLRP